MTFQWLVQHAAAVRAVSFLAALPILAVWEHRRSLRAPLPFKRARQCHNLVLLVISTLLLRVIFPFTVVGVALYAERQDLGLLNQMHAPLWLSLPLSIVLFDLAIYGQHVLLHSLTPLWRLHRVHHTDLDLDVSSGLRFHPLEILLSTVFKMALVLLLGLPAVAVLCFEVLLNCSSMFNHSNIRLGERTDTCLRKLIVTPRMHWVHHSSDPRETRSNFGFCLSCWDRLFGTYRSAPAAGYERMQLGVSGYEGRVAIRVDELLLQPFDNAEVSGGIYTKSSDRV